LAPGKDEIDASLHGPRDHHRVQLASTSSTCSTALGSDECALDLSGELDPGVVRPVGRKDFIGVIMPMRI
jgi:hypothetical protein